LARSRKKELLKKKRRRDQRKSTTVREKRSIKKAPLCDFSIDPKIGVPVMNMGAVLQAIVDRDNEVWNAFIKYLLFFESHHYKQFGSEAIKRLNVFVHCFFTAMAVEDFLPEPKQITNLIQLGHILQHVVASSSYQTCDRILNCTLGMQNNVPKIMMLMNPRCEIQLDQEKLFEIEPNVASLWYMTYMMGLSSPTELIQKNLYRHLEKMSERFTPPRRALSGLYFSCTYHNPNSVRRVKGIINKGIKTATTVPTFVNSPDPKSIAIVTNRWHRNHAVYKSASPLVEQLVGKYKLTLIWTAPPDAVPPTVVKDYFDAVHHCYFRPDESIVFPPEVMNNDFQMVYYPDIGMSDESIWLSNARIAPIQAVGYGHPDTTGDNNEIDYFIGGQIEKEATDAYSETMVLIPGLAQEPAWPTAPRQNNYIDDGIVRVNCVWGPDKYNFTLLKMLVEINKAVDKIKPTTYHPPTHEFHLFGSPGMNRYAALPPFAKEIAQLLPNAVLHTEQEYYDYMKNAEMHDFSLNSFPFGCYNVLVESLYMGLPFLSLVGNRFYNRAGMYLNERVGMGYNNFETPKDFIEQAAELITNPETLRTQREHLASVDLKRALFTLEGEHFLEAVQYIIANHPFNETKIIGGESC